MHLVQRLAERFTLELLHLSVTVFSLKMMIHDVLFAVSFSPPQRFKIVFRSEIMQVNTKVKEKNVTRSVLLTSNM